MKYRGMKKVAAFFMAIALAAGNCPAWMAETTGIAVEVNAADYGEYVDSGEEGDYLYTVYTGGVVIDGYEGNATELVVPSRIGGRQVTEVDLSYTVDAGRITKVTVSEGIKVIGSSCFYEYSGLSSVNLPSTLTEIGYNAFYGCSSLSNIKIPDSVTSIGEVAFEGCSNLDTINIPAGMTELINYQFSESSLKSIVIPGTITRIGACAFHGCKELKSVTISEGVSEIGDSAFRWSGITSLTIPGSVKRIGKNAFESCSSLTSLTLKNGVGRLEDSAFWGCDGLTSITIPGSVGNIGADAFSYCKGLTNVVIQEGVTTIGDYAFSGCHNIKSITIPNSVTSIGTNAFGYDQISFLCSKDSYAYQYLLREGLIPSQQGSGGTTVTEPFPAGNTRTVSGGIYVSLGNGKAAFKAPSNKKKASVKVLDSLKVSGKTYKVTQIKANAFSGCSKLKKITVKATSLTSVGKKALKGIHKKAVVKVPKAKYQSYKKLFKGKGQAKTVKIKK